jgi:hypothetical protein
MRFVNSTMPESNEDIKICIQEAFEAMSAFKRPNLVNWAYNKRVPCQLLLTQWKRRNPSLNTPIPIGGFVLLRNKLCVTGHYAKKD